ncbi:M28 family peptidase [Marilutibacter alkalisoli]|nr:M28 family peptidase [Lysobacter alkalisoli]
MRHLNAFTATAVLVLLTACASRPVSHPAPALSPAASGWQAAVTAIAAGGDNGGRGQAIVQRLDTLGIDWRRQDFEIDGFRGANLLADIGGPADAPVLLLGAHFDKVDAGDGVTDNASGSAVVLALAERFRQQPLVRHQVAIAFWDLEERGLLGSRAHIAQGSEQPVLYVNFDVFGWGDTLWMMTPDPDSPLTVSTRTAANAAGLGLTTGGQYPPTDHEAFLKAGWPANSYSLVDADEIAGILAMYKGDTPGQVPKVMEVIHSDGDTLAAVDPEAVARGIDVVEVALRNWDAEGGTTGAND